MKPEAHPPAPAGGSLARVLVGVLLLLVAMSIAVFGFLSLVRVLDGGGYGSPKMRQALAVLGVSGGCFAGGIATLIWEVAKRQGRS